jgi:hypothetical protein
VAAELGRRRGLLSNRVYDLRSTWPPGTPIKDAGGSAAMARFLRRLMDHSDSGLPGAHGSGRLALLEYDPDNPS